MSRKRHHDLGALFLNRKGEGYEFRIIPKQRSDDSADSRPIRYYQFTGMENPHITKLIKQKESEIQTLTWINGYVLQAQPDIRSRVLFYEMNHRDILMVHQRAFTSLASCSLFRVNFLQEKIVFSDVLIMDHQQLLLKVIFGKEYYLYHWSTPAMQAKKGGS